MKGSNEKAHPSEQLGRAEERARDVNLESHIAAASPRGKPSFDVYIRAGLQLIPLHGWNSVDAKGRPRGKTPRDAYWTTRQYDNEEVAAYAANSGANVGIRLPANVVVLDVDPRNFAPGQDSMLELRHATGLSLTGAPHTATGSGGDHFWYRKDPELQLMETHPDFPGIEFKSKGRQVVAAGSIHPNGNEYRWVGTSDLTNLPTLPDELLALIRKPQLAQGQSPESGELTPEMLATTLEQLDPCNFREHDAWLSLMMACHHATDGEGKQEWIDWSTSDPKYSSDGANIGSRWDSLRSRPGHHVRQVTSRYLHKVVNEAGGWVPNSAPEDDFDALENLGHAPTKPDVIESIIEEMNSKHYAVSDGGFHIITEEMDPVLRRVRYQRLTRSDFRAAYENRLVEDSGRRMVSKAELWLKSPNRRQYKGMIFDPENDHEGWLNLWKGWSVEPKEGDWSLLKDLIQDVLVDGDRACYEYVMNWMAFMVQHPGQPAEVAIAFRGEKGTGKGTLGRALAELAGSQGLHIANPAQLVGRFNSHLQNCIMLFADEAFWAGNKEGESVLKQLVTEPTITYEGKGRDAVSGRNLIHIMMASNSQWVVPAGLDGERRFAVFSVNKSRQGDNVFFARLHEQMYGKKRAGLSAMLFELLSRDIGSWAPRNNVPQTKALSEQKLLSMHPEEAAWTDLLDRGTLPEFVVAAGAWEVGEVTLPAQELHNLYVQFVRAHGMGRAKPYTAWTMSMKSRVGAERVQVKREWMWRLPPLDEARAIWAKVIGSFSQL